MEKLYAVRLYDKHNNQWHDKISKVTLEIAKIYFNSVTLNNSIYNRYEDEKYYKIFLLGC